MSGPESTPPDDQLLDEFLAGEGAVRTVYRQSASERAPAHLDAAILQAAQSVPRPMPRRVRSRWQAPMATAAVLVLGIGVLLQVQRDPAARQAVTAPPPAAPAAVLVPEQKAIAAKADLIVEAEQAPAEEAADARPAPAPAKPALQIEKRRALAVPETPSHDPLPPPPSPPPPATAMADAAAAPMGSEPAEPMAAAAGALAAESLQRQERPAAAPMAKAKRAPAAANLLGAPPDAFAPAGGGADAAAAIEQWAGHCGVSSTDLETPTQWRGLTVTRWTATTLQFAAAVSHDAIVSALGALASRTTLATADCSGPVTRELRRSGEGWALVCECSD